MTGSGTQPPTFLGLCILQPEVWAAGVLHHTIQQPKLAAVQEQLCCALILPSPSVQLAGLRGTMAWQGEHVMGVGLPP